MEAMTRLVVLLIAFFILAAGRLLAQSEGQAENTADACQDGVDNDGDTFTDCKDQDCSFFVFCHQSQEQQPAQPPPAPAVTNENSVELCRDFKDNDNDGHIDCDDQDCAIFSFCMKPEAGKGVFAGPRKSKGGIGFYLSVVVAGRSDGKDTHQYQDYSEHARKTQNKMNAAAGFGLFGEALVRPYLAVGGELYLAFPTVDESRSYDSDGDEWSSWAGCEDCETDIVFQAMLRLKFPFKAGRWVGIYPFVSVGLSNVTTRFVADSCGVEGEESDTCNYIGPAYGAGLGVEIYTPTFATPFIEMRYYGAAGWNADLPENEDYKYSDMALFHSAALNFGMRIL
jgi:hypothetical protein